MKSESAKLAEAHQERQDSQQENTADETVLRTRGQRRINLIWEITQSLIALGSIGGGLYIMIHNAINGYPSTPIPPTLANMIFLVIGFYFARTNHSATGGVGPTQFPGQRR